MEKFPKSFVHYSNYNYSNYNYGNYNYSNYYSSFIFSISHSLQLLSNYNHSDWIAIRMGHVENATRFVWHFLMSIGENMTNQEIRKYIEELADDKYKEFHSGICKGPDIILGVRIPKMEAFAKQFVKEQDWRAYLTNASDETYEEIILQGFVIAMQKDATEEEFFSFLETFVGKIHNWGVCDLTCARLKQTKKYEKHMWEFLQKYAYSNEEFEIRFALVMFLDYYLKEEYLQQVFSIVEDITHPGYYVKMAQAWLLTTAFSKHRDATWEFLQHAELDKEVIGKMVQKCRDSYRVSAEDKKMLTAWRTV